MAATNPKGKAIVLVPGMSSVASLVYVPLITAIKKNGHTSVHAIDLPSIDPQPENIKPTPLEADIAAIRKVLVSLIEEQGLDVIVVAHSYGGTPALCASEGLWKTQREGSKGGVVRAGLMSSSLCLPGGTVAGDRMEYGKEHPGELNDEGARIEVVGENPIVFPDNFQYAWFNDLPESEMMKWGETLRPATLGAVLTSAPPTDPKNWKISYLLTTGMDLAMPEQFQKGLAERAGKAGAEVEVREIRSGHFVQISHVQEVTAWVEGMCG